MCQQGRSVPTPSSEQPPAGRCPECAIFAGDSEQFHAGANIFFWNYDVARYFGVQYPEDF